MLKNPYSGKFVVFEGGDGVGKSKQARLALEHCRAEISTSVVLSKEPYTRTPDGQPVHLGEEIYKVLKGEHDRTELADLTLEQFQRYFYFPNRVQHYLDIIIPALRDGRHVLSDRGAPSVCYGSSNSWSLHQLMAEQLAMMGALRLPWPDAILIYDVPADIAIERMIASGKVLDAHERIDTLERVRESYRSFAEQWPNCYLIDGLPPSEDVWETRTKPILEQVLA